MANIRDALRETNPWWESGFNLRIKDREIYQQVQKFMPMRQIIAITGLRRVGKTFLLYKIVEDSIKKGFKPHNILYFSFDVECDKSKCKEEFSEVSN